VALWAVILAVVLVDGLAALAMLGARRRAPGGGHFAEAQRAAGAFTVTGTIFAVLVGFVFLLAFQSYQSARSSAQDEALAALALFNSAARFPAPSAGELQGDVVCYARAVIDHEWPAMADGRSSGLVDGWVSRMNAGFDRVEPRGAAEAAAVQNWFDEADALDHGRRGRLAEASRVIPTTIWILLLLVGLVVISFVLLLADPAEQLLPQLAMIVAVATAVAAGLLTVNFLDRPYGGHVGAITPKAMRAALSTIEREPAVAAGAAAPACDGSGRPRA
jgi:hypothetical protein